MMKRRMFGQGGIVLTALLLAAGCGKPSGRSSASQGMKPAVAGKDLHAGMEEECVGMGCDSPKGGSNE